MRCQLADLKNGRTALLACIDQLTVRTYLNAPQDHDVIVMTNNQDSDAASRKPLGELSIRTLAMPTDTNQDGDIFGGWLLGQMDIAGSMFAYKIAKGKTVTVAVDAMSFRQPVFVGDVVCVYANLIRVGTTSICIHIEAWVIRRNEERPILVTEGNFTYVAIGKDSRPRPVAQPKPI